MASFRKSLTLYDDYHAMMSDPVRTAAYQAAIARTVRPGDVVVDLGSGLGILSFLALRAGASRVYAIEKSDSIELARKVAAANGLSDRIHFLAANSKECALEEKADLLLSETLGSFAVDENTLDFTIDARDRFLAPDARMLPCRLKLWLAPVRAPQSARRLDYWRDVSGFDYSPAIDECVSRMSLATFEARNLLAAPQCYADIDLARVQSPHLEAKLLFPIEKKGTIHGLAGWFEAELCEGVSIDTSPAAPPTHWQQAFFPFREAVEVVRGDYLETTLRIGPESPTSDNTSVAYDYRCTQIAKQASSGVPSRNAACPCGSGLKYKRCCGK